MAKDVRPATSRLTRATRVIVVTTSRRASEEGTSRPSVFENMTGRSERRFENVARAAECVDHRLTSRVDLLAKVGDVELHDVRLSTEVVVPHPVEDLHLGHDSPRVAHQEAQQFELRRGQADLLATAEDLATVLVHRQVADGQHRVDVGVGGAGTSHQSAEPGYHLLEAEGFG